MAGQWHLRVPVSAWSKPAYPETVPEPWLLESLLSPQYASYTVAPLGALLRGLWAQHGVVVVVESILYRLCQYPTLCYPKRTAAGPFHILTVQK